MKFEPGFDWRVKVVHGDREGPMYLYSKTEKECQDWMKAVEWAKTKTQYDRQCLETCVQRIGGVLAYKAWDSMVRHWRETADTKHTVQKFSMRLLRADLSRGWAKLRMVYEKHKEEEKRKAEQKSYAIQFLKDKMSGMQ